MQKPFCSINHPIDAPGLSDWPRSSWPADNWQARAAQLRPRAKSLEFANWKLVALANQIDEDFRTCIFNLSSPCSGRLFLCAKPPLACCWGRAGQLFAVGLQQIKQQATCCYCYCVTLAAACDPNQSNQRPTSPNNKSSRISSTLRVGCCRRLASLDKPGTSRRG